MYGSSIKVWDKGSGENTGYLLTVIAITSS